MQLSVKDIHKDPELRLWFEALLVDTGTPKHIYKDLFGIEEDLIEVYQDLHFPESKFPRMLLLKHLKNIGNERVRETKLKVFFEGWEWISAEINYGKGVDGVSTGEKIARSLLARLSAMATSGSIKIADFKMFKELLTLATNTKKVQVEENFEDELLISLKALSTPDERIESVVEEYNKVIEAGQNTSQVDEVLASIEGQNNLKKEAEI